MATQQSSIFAARQYLNDGIPVMDPWIVVSMVFCSRSSAPNETVSIWPGMAATSFSANHIARVCLWEKCKRLKKYCQSLLVGEVQTA
jgi:hypothetical protein